MTSSETMVLVPPTPSEQTGPSSPRRDQLVHQARSRRGVLVALLSLALVAVPWPMPAGAQAAEPVLTVSPATDLRDDQVVEVRGAGFAAQEYLVGMCRRGATDLVGSSCAFHTFVNTTADASGSFTTDVQVERFLNDGECLERQCAVVAFATGFRPVVDAPITFADTPPAPPTVSVSTENLVDTDTVRVTASGISPNSTGWFRQCPADATSPDACGWPNAVGTANDRGELVTTIRVKRAFPIFSSPRPPVDCAVEACIIALTDGPFFPKSEPLHFVDPELAVEIEPNGTLQAGTNEAVARLTVSCDVATPVSLRAALRQDGITRTYVLEDERCEPDRRLLVFVPTRKDDRDDADYALGAAELSVEVSPTDDIFPEHPSTALTSAVGPIQLLDHDEVAAAIQVLLADPANVELRDELRQALQTRVRQDDVFADRWRWR